MNRTCSFLLFPVLLATIGITSCSPKSNSDFSISFEVIDTNSASSQINSDIEEGKINDARTLIYKSVTIELMESGYNVGLGNAATVDNNHYNNTGLFYYRKDDSLFTDNSLMACGFYEIVEGNEPFYDLFEDESSVQVWDLNENNNDIDYILTYANEQLAPSHFIFEDKYVQYYQQSSTRIAYKVMNNAKDNYDLSFGSLYNYDTKRFIYDESIQGEYVSHSGVTFLEEKDYVELERSLQAYADEQLKNGYKVDEYKIVYISPDALQKYINSQEEETFFGYSVESLKESIGVGKAIEISENGISEAQVIEEKDFNWKSFLIKMGIGAGIIIVGAALSYFTGGTSFCCALITISKYALSFATTSALGTLAIKTTTGLIEGKTIKESIRDASYDSFDAFGTGFIIGAAVGSVGLLTGVIKPVACFSGETIVSMYDGTQKRISDIQIGDKVATYDFIHYKENIGGVYDIFVKDVKNGLDVILENGETIETTPEHPFWSASSGCWKPAKLLDNNDYIYCQNGAPAKISHIKENNSIKQVYNFSVSGDHNYYVGESKLLVHNECTTIQGQRNKAVNDAWKNYRDNMDNFNPLNLKPSDFNQYGRVPGIDGVHIKDVSKLIGTKHEYLISDWHNIVLMPKASHFEVHARCWSNTTDPNLIVKLCPWAAEQVAKILKLFA